MQEKILFETVKTKLVAGVSKVESSLFGTATYIGHSAEGDVVLQIGSTFLTFPEYDWNLQEFSEIYSPVTHTVYITEECAMNARLGIFPECVEQQYSSRAKYELSFTVSKVDDYE